MWIVKIALERPYTFVVLALGLAAVGRLQATPDQLDALITAPRLKRVLTSHLMGAVDFSDPTTKVANRSRNCRLTTVPSPF
jgi:hypothetical protein